MLSPPIYGHAPLDQSAGTRAVYLVLGCKRASLSSAVDDASSAG